MVHPAENHDSFEAHYNEDTDVLLERLANIMLDIWLEERTMKQNEREFRSNTYDRESR